MKKFLLKIITLIMLTGVFLSFTVVFAVDKTTVTVGSVSGDKGSIVEISVVISENLGFSNLGIEIEYNSNVLELVNAVNNSSVGATYTPSQNLSSNPYSMSWDSTANTAFNGTLAILTFKVNETASNGTYPVTVSYYKGRNNNYTDGVDVNYDENFNSLMLNYVNGAVTVNS